MIKNKQSNKLIEHPSHYNKGNIECIDAVEEALGPEGFQAFCRGNIIKYSWRAGMKDASEQDLGKAAWYANRAIESIKKQNNINNK